MTNFFAVDGNDCKIASEKYLERCDQKGHRDLRPQVKCTDSDLTREPLIFLQLVTNDSVGI